MTQPNAAAPSPNPKRTPAEVAGGLAETLGDGTKPGHDPVEATALDPSRHAAADETVAVDHLAFPRVSLGPDVDPTVAFETARVAGADDATVDAEGRPRPDAHSADFTLDAEWETRLAPPDPNAETLDAEGITRPSSEASAGDFEAEISVNLYPRVPGYQILGELGRGGMGVVYKAIQEKLDRPVALKMILAGAHASKEQINRFLVEAQAVAHLNHTNIVKIFAIGDYDGLPFFSLDFIDGGNLKEAIAGKPQPVTSCAGMVRTLASAMAEAHKAGIIHRDLKPANILLSGDGAPKITDFGLAKRLEGDSQQTRDGAVMGTPSYMAPEQALGLTREIGPAADQHALGAILYEMLTGRPPYQGTTALETLDLVRNQEPVPPSRLQPKVPRDLETICLKSLQKEPEKRYATCEAMAEDLGRYLDDKPILARPVSAPERAIRWCKRNRMAAVAIASVASLLLGSSAICAAAAVIVSKKNADLIAANKTAEDAKEVAETNEALARRREAETRALALTAVDQTDTMIEAQRYTAVLANSRLRDLPVDTAAIRDEMFKVALKSMDRAAKVMADLRAKNAGNKDSDALASRTLALIHQHRGEVFMEMGPEAADKVLPEFREMDRLANALFQSDPGNLEALKNYASSQLTLGNYQFRVAGNMAAAEAHFLNALKHRKTWLDKGDDDVAKVAVANVLGALARLHQRTGEPLKAVPLYDEEVKLRDGVGGDMASDIEFRRERAGLFDALGDLNLRLGRVVLARKSYENSFEVRTEIVKEMPRHFRANLDIYRSYEKFGDVFLIYPPQDPARAREMYQKEKDGFAEWVKFDPADSRAKNSLAMALYRLGTACLATKDMAASQEAYRECRDLRKGIAALPAAKKNPQKIYEANLMLALARCGDHAEAAKIADDLVATKTADRNMLKEAACGYALAAEAAKADHVLPSKYKAAAFETLRKAIDLKWRSEEDLKNEPDLDPIKDDPEFLAILEDLHRRIAAETAAPKP